MRESNPSNYSGLSATTPPSTRAIKKWHKPFARILHASGNIDFGILYEAEMTAGNDVRRVGEEGLFEHVAESQYRNPRPDCEFKRIVTTDPHSFNTLKNEYSEFGGDYESRALQHNC